MIKNNQNLLNIVIPTKNRSETLKYAVSTILRQKHKNFRIIISDNNSSDETQNIIKKFNDRRIIYFHHKKNLTMRENWEFALSKAEKGYVTIMGDDDGFCENCFSKINQIINQKKNEIISWTTTSYFWPNNQNQSFVEFRTHSKEEEIIYSNKKLKNILGMLEIYSDGPMIYNSFLSVDLVKKIKKKQNDLFFLHGIPDISSLFSILLNSEKYYRINYPIGIAGSSKTSNGSILKNNKNNFEEIKNNLKQLNVTENIVPSYYFTTLYPYYEFAKIYSSIKKFYPINYFNLISRVIEELKIWNNEDYHKFYSSFLFYLKNEFKRIFITQKIKILFSNFYIQSIDFYVSKKIQDIKNENGNILKVSKILLKIYNSKKNEKLTLRKKTIKVLKISGFYGIFYFIKNLFVIIRVLRDIK
jgi:glycosyltransferase involved in cell wall biosynthesis